MYTVNYGIPESFITISDWLVKFNEKQALVRANSNKLHTAAGLPRKTIKQMFTCGTQKVD